MNLYVLQEISRHFSGQIIRHIARIDDNLIKLELQNHTFYINLEKSKSAIFCTTTPLLARKQYIAPFDFALQKYCLRAEILSCDTDGNNRILRLVLQKKLQYKTLQCVLQLEFTGRHTNAIILDNKSIVLECLRKVTQSSREVRVGYALAPLPQQRYNPQKITLDCDIYTFLCAQYENYIRENLESSKKIALQALQRKKIALQELLNNLPDKNTLQEKSAYYAEIGALMKNNMGREFFGSEIVLSDFFGNEKKYELDFDTSLKSNAALMNECFARSKKLSAKAKNISLQEENLEDSIAFLECKIDFVREAKTLGDVKMIYQKARSASRASKKEAKYESFFIDGAKISIGKNKAENIEILKDAKANDTWLHVRGIPSSHIIIHTSKNNPSDEILRKAGELAVSFLRLKSGNFLVDYTKRKFIKIKDGANVVYSNYGTMTYKKDQ